MNRDRLPGYPFPMAVRRVGGLSNFGPSILELDDAFLPGSDPSSVERREPEGTQIDNAWARLSRKQNVGQRVILPFYTDSGKQRSPTQMIRVQGNTWDAQELTITVLPPYLVPIDLLDQPDQGGSFENLRGEEDNQEIPLLGNFPGSSAPIVWAPTSIKISWGVGGHPANAEVDIANGTSISLTASSLDVYAQIDDLPEGMAEVTTTAAYAISAFVGPGSTAASFAQRTVYVGQIGSLLESAAFPVPRFARSAAVYACDTGTDPQVSVGSIRFWRSPDKGANNVGNFFYSGNQEAQVRVPNGGQYFSVKSGMEGTNLFAVVFDLSIC